MSLYPPVGALAPAQGNDSDAALRARFDQAFPQPRAANDFANPLDVGSAALAPIDIGQPGADLKYRPGVFERIQNRPGGSEALLAFGANMLTEPNFFAGLGKGALAYQQVLNAERDKLSPQLTKDQEFSYKRNPATGDYEFQETAAGRRALEVARAKMDTSRDNTIYRADRAYDGKTYGVDRQYDFKDRELGYRDTWEKNRNATRIRSAEIVGQFGMDRTRLQAATQAGKPPPVGVLKEYDEHEGKAHQADGILDLGGLLMDDIQSGALDLGLGNNLRAKFSQATGYGATENTRAYARWQQFQQQLVNGILLDAKGTQAEGDAIRAKIQTAVSSGDTEGAKREIANAMQMVERGRDYSMARASDISRQYGVNVDSTASVRSGPHPSPSTRVSPPSRPNVSPRRGWGKVEIER